VDRQEEKLVINGKILASRLERLSADSHWAHKASGLRGSLLKLLQQIEVNTKSDDIQRLKELIPLGQGILNQAAKEIPDINALLKEDRDR
jgi:hypothetical protein